MSFASETYARVEQMIEEALYETGETVKCKDDMRDYIAMCDRVIARFTGLRHFSQEEQEEIDAYYR